MRVQRQDWRLSTAVVDGAPGVAARLDLPAGQWLRCEIAGLTMVASTRGPVFRLSPGRALAMRTVADGVEDADAAVVAADELFDALVGLARPRPSTRRARRPAC